LLGGTTTVVFCGGGGLLLLIQPVINGIITLSDINRAFIPIPPGYDNRSVVSRTSVDITVIQTRDLTSVPSYRRRRRRIATGNLKIGKSTSS
jgi:hypothetical protein